MPLLRRSFDPQRRGPSASMVHMGRVTGGAYEGPSMDDDVGPSMGYPEVELPGPPRPIYLIMYEGVVYRVETTAAEARRRMADRGPGWVCLARIGDRIREVCRNPVPSRGGH